MENLYSPRKNSESTGKINQLTEKFFSALAPEIIFGIKSQERSMLLNEFSPNLFGPNDDRQSSLLEDIKMHHAKYGAANRIQILRSLARTKPYTRTVYPENWRGK